MKVRCQVYDLDLIHTFRISRSASDSRRTVLVEIEHDGIVGRGEGAPSTHLGESPSSVCKAIESLGPQVQGSPRLFHSQLLHWEKLLPGQYAALSAVDIALHDWAAQCMGVPLYEMWGLDPSSAGPTSMTIAIASPGEMVARALDAWRKGFRILKLKVGFPGDVDAVTAVRERTDAIIRVDANGGWSLKEALEKAGRLSELGVELLEQPLPPDDRKGLRILHDNSPLPIFLDESIRDPEDTLRLADGCDGVVLKLGKCGGLIRARRMLDVARAAGLGVMLGGTIGTWVATTAAAHLSPLADKADLDSPWLIRNDPYEGVGVMEGVLSLPEKPGLGVRARQANRAGAGSVP